MFIITPSIHLITVYDKVTSNRSEAAGMRVVNNSDPKLCYFDTVGFSNVEVKYT